jgi:hypothetical protein
MRSSSPNTSNSSLFLLCFLLFYGNDRGDLDVHSTYQLFLFVKGSFWIMLLELLVDILLVLHVQFLPSIC